MTVERKTLSELAVSGGLFSDGDWVESKDQDPEGTVRLIQLADVGDGRFRDRSSRFVTPEKVEELGGTYLRPGDVLIARMPDPLGRACVFPDIGRPAITAVDVCIFRSSADTNPRYITHMINSPQFRSRVLSLQSGTTRKRISRRNLGTIDLPVPGRQEQDAVVEGIEKHLTRLRAATQSTRRAGLNLQRYQAAVYDAAIAGRLIRPRVLTQSAAALLGDLGVGAAEGSEQLPSGWAWARLGDLARVGSGATPKKDRRDYYEGGTIPWVTSGALNEEFVTEPTAHITERALRETSVKLWPAHTLLVAMYGEGRTRGKCSELLFPSTTNQACAAVVFSEAAMPLQPWIKMYLTARYEENRRLALGGVQPNLSLGFVKQLVVPIPPLNEQEVILQEVSRRMSIGLTAERALTLAESRSKALERKILANAYRGSLMHETAAA